MIWWSPALPLCKTNYYNSLVWCSAALQLCKTNYYNSVIWCSAALQDKQFQLCDLMISCSAALQDKLLQLYDLLLCCAVALQDKLLQLCDLLVCCATALQDKLLQLCTWSGYEPKREQYKRSDIANSLLMGRNLCSRPSNSTIDRRTRPEDFFAYGEKRTGDISEICIDTGNLQPHIMGSILNALAPPIFFLTGNLVKYVSEQSMWIEETSEHMQRYSSQYCVTFS